ncbi:hypothetical protein HY450_01340 [Candidatus Pacearchaeota archaeon]|nr:hypothetical protein [Candidatus Pacearchaeota archaeon]
MKMPVLILIVIILLVVFYLAVSDTPFNELIKLKEKANPQTENEIGNAAPQSEDVINEEDNEGSDFAESKQTIPVVGGCIEKQISYSMKNFATNSECESYDETCVQKKVDCSVEVKNLDYEVSDLFSVKIKIINEQTGQEFQSIIVEKNVSSRETESFEYSFIIEGEDADGDFNCIFSTEKVPVKEFCYS